MEVFMTKRAEKEIKRSVKIIGSLIEEMNKASFYSRGNKNFKIFLKDFKMIESHLERNEYNIKKLFQNATELHSNHYMTKKGSFESDLKTSERVAENKRKWFARFVRELE